jgi:phosphoheptose isomerase
MDYYQIIANNFQATIESIALSVDDLVDPLTRASALMSSALLQDRKILCCGNGVDAALAQLFASSLLDRFERDRPALPALNLAADGASVTAIGSHSGVSELFSRQIRALGQAGDVLLCINSAGSEADNLLRAAQAAGEREIGVVALTSDGAGQLNSLPGQDDVSIHVNTNRRPRNVEIHTMIIHCLCELLDQALFGPHHLET